MNIWELLDIPPPTDIVRIKSAYAKQAKLYHPEEHPEKFKALQNAYKIAVQMTKSQNATTHITPANILKRELETEPSADIIERDMEEEKQKDASKHNIEHFFDFSDIDSYGDRERFFEQFLLIADNPYLCNNLDVWEYFLDRKEFAELFVDTDFRIKLVHIMCDRFGWRRKTILYFERYLKKFHAEKNKPIGGI